MTSRLSDMCGPTVLYHSISLSIDPNRSSLSFTVQKNRSTFPFVSPVKTDW